MTRYIPLDEDGYFWFDGTKVEDQAIGSELLGNLRLGPKAAVMTSMKDQEAYVEAFDAPLVARHVALGADGLGQIDLPYQRRANFDFAALTLDEWDRFHGVTTDGLPFVFSRTAQVEFFDLLDGFDDDSITVTGRRFDIPPWLSATDAPGRQEFWSNLYKAGDLGWDLDQEAPALAAVLPQLKLSRQRILVPGCGIGHDAAYLARQGHSVTAVDFSQDAVDRARARYPSIEGLRFMRADVFNLPNDFTNRFDLVFEHTCYCAVDPRRRDALIKAYRRALDARGHLLGIFYVNERPAGPPFGGSEWEIRQRLRAGFHSIFWTRWRHSVESRRGRELVVYANKLEK